MLRVRGEGMNWRLAGDMYYEPAGITHRNTILLLSGLALGFRASGLRLQVEIIAPTPPTKNKRRSLYMLRGFRYSFGVCIGFLHISSVVAYLLGFMPISFVRS